MLLDETWHHIYAMSALGFVRESVAVSLPPAWHAPDTGCAVAPTP